MPTKSAKQAKSARHKEEQKEQAHEARSARAQEASEERQDRLAPTREARKIRDDAIRKQVHDDRMREIDLMAAADEEAAAKEKKPHLLTGKPGSGAGLKPGDMFAPKSNPGAAARVPTQPLQPESMQSHGKGILYDKDIDNGPFAEDDPTAVDAPPFGSNPRTVDKDAEVEKAEKMTARGKQRDPDNPTVGYKGKDATASPNPMGSTHRSKNNVAGGSNSGSEA